MMVIGFCNMAFAIFAIAFSYQHNKYKINKIEKNRMLFILLLNTTSIQRIF